MITPLANRAIPTCVGNTSPLAHLACVWTGHPHVCGEHESAELLLLQLCGPSPRVWGTQVLVSTVRKSDRAIPTCVGNTWRETTTRRPGTGHPHVCGEHNLIVSPTGDFVGPSPRVWGTLFFFFLKIRSQRAIPTCVGNTLGEIESRINHLGHPHVCGEHTKMM